MGRHSCSIPNKSKKLASESKRATTSRVNKIFRNNAARSRGRIFKRNSDARVDSQFCCSLGPHRERRGEANRFAGAIEQRCKTKTSLARSRKRDRAAPRLFSAVAKESTGIQTRAWRSAFERTRP